LTVTGVFVFGESTKIWHIDGERREEADDNVEGFHCRPTGIEASSEDNRAVDERSTAMSDNCTPKEEGKEGGRNNDGFEAEEVAELVHGKTRDSSLDHPVQEDHEKLTASDVGARWKFVGEICVGGPDGGHHVLEIAASLNCRDGSPLSNLERLLKRGLYHECNESTDQDGRDTAPHAKRDTSDDREWSVVHGTDATK
jgi:hypothetical protein